MEKFYEISTVGLKTKRYQQVERHVFDPGHFVVAS
jgi:hypothetical protein